LVDVGCGDGYYTRGAAQQSAVTVAGVDIAKAAVAAAAGQHRGGWYAVASAFDLPLDDGCVDLLLSVFGPVAPDEFARVVRPGGTVVAVHPGPRHLEQLRALVYDEPQPHETKDPLRGLPGTFTRTDLAAVRYPLAIDSSEVAGQLFAMTPYRWHAPRDIYERLAQRGGLDTEVDVMISTYRKAGPSKTLEPMAEERPVDSGAWTRQTTRTGC
jgi:23S rRNA (guanine745-N1)-methyltransferase